MEIYSYYFSTVARIQFKLPNGVSKMNKFEPEDTIDDLYTYVMNEIENPYGSNVSLQTTFPLRELDQVFMKLILISRVFRIESYKPFIF